MPNLGTRAVLGKVLRGGAVLGALYLLVGVGFHVAWKSALSACREARIAHGEWVEPEVLGGGLGFLFDVTFWPVYAWANIYHDGTPLATPCTHGGAQ